MTRLRAVTHFCVQARSSIPEYVEALRNRYYGTSKKEKGKMLDEFTQVAGHDPFRLALREESGAVSLLGVGWVKKKRRLKSPKFRANLVSFRINVLLNNQEVCI